MCNCGIFESCYGCAKCNCKHAQEAIQRVLELHKPKMHHARIGDWEVCTSCYDDEGFQFIYPCPTIEKLEELS